MYVPFTTGSLGYGNETISDINIRRIVTVTIKLLFLNLLNAACNVTGFIANKKKA